MPMKRAGPSKCATLSRAATLFLNPGISGEYIFGFGKPIKFVTDDSRREKLRRQPDAVERMCRCGNSKTMRISTGSLAGESEMKSLQASKRSRIEKAYRKSLAEDASESIFRGK